MQLCVCDLAVKVVGAAAGTVGRIVAYAVACIAAWVQSTQRACIGPAQREQQDKRRAHGQQAPQIVNVEYHGKGGYNVLEHARAQVLLNRVNV